MITFTINSTIKMKTVLFYQQQINQVGRRTLQLSTPPFPSRVKVCMTREFCRSFERSGGNMNLTPQLKDFILGKQYQETHT